MLTTRITPESSSAERKWGLKTTVKLFQWTCCSGTLARLHGVESRQHHELSPNDGKERAMQQHPKDTLGIDDQRLLDRLCDRFRSGWRAATQDGSAPPAIEKLLNEVSEPPRSALFVELLRIEFEVRRTIGATLSHDEYRSRFSDRVEVVDRLFAEIEPPPAKRKQKQASVPTVEGVEPETIFVVDRYPRLDATGPFDPSDRHELPPPERIGHFKVIRVLGTGSFGTVYLAHDEKLKRPVAIKVPHCLGNNAAAVANPEWLDQFRLEAQKTASLDDPRIVPVYDIHELDDGRPCIVSKYVAGSDLATRLKAGPFDHSSAVAIAEQIARALHHAHLHGLVHRDIKPQNILIQENGQPVVADFGLAIHEQERRKFRGDIAGSPAYMSPEQVRGDNRDIDGRSDIWSLGVIVYELLTRRRPYVAPSIPELFDAIQKDRVKPPRQIDDSIPVELERIVLKCLEKDPQSRYTTAKDLANDLQSWRTSGTTGSPTRKRVVVRTFAVTAVAIVVGFVIWFSRPTPAPLDGSIDLKREFRSSLDQKRTIETLSESPTAFRIASGNLVQVNAELSRPSFVYILWIEADGNVVPVYPWVDFDWTQRPAGERTVAEVARPDGMQGWPVGGPAGIETIVLLAREARLSPDVDLAKLLAGIPSLDLPPELQRRGPRDAEAPRTMGAIDDDERLRMLRSRLQEHFPLIRTVSFANLGEVQHSE